MLRINEVVPVAQMMLRLTAQMIQGFALMIYSPYGLMIYNPYGIDDIQHFVLMIYTACAVIYTLSPDYVGSSPKGRALL